MFNKIEFSKRLSELMKDNDDTVYTLAEAVHLSPGTISKYTNGKLEPRRNTIEAIASYYNINPVWLMGANGVEKYLEDALEKYRKVPIIGTIAAGQPILQAHYICLLSPTKMSLSNMILVKNNKARIGPGLKYFNPI